MLDGKAVRYSETGRLRRVITVPLLMKLKQKRTCEIVKKVVTIDERRFLLLKQIPGVALHFVGEPTGTLDMVSGSPVKALVLPSPPNQCKVKTRESLNRLLKNKMRTPTPDIITQRAENGKRICPCVVHVHGQEATHPMSGLKKVENVRRQGGKEI